MFTQHPLGILGYESKRLRRLRLSLTISRLQALTRLAQKKHFLCLLRIPLMRYRGSTKGAKRDFFLCLLRISLVKNTCAFR